MTRSRILARGLLVVFLVAGLVLGAALVPSLMPVRAASPAAISPGDIVISQFRFRGTGTDPDEFVELFNRSSASVNLGGLTLKRSDSAGGVGVLVATLPVFSLVKGQYYVLANPSYDQAPPVTADAQFDPGAAGIPDDGGVAIMDGTTILDQVGLSSTSAFIEPNPPGGSTILTPLTADVDQGYIRNAGGCADTNNNSTDFAGPVASAPRNRFSPTAPCPVAGLALVKTITSGGIYSNVGNQIKYSYVVTNTGGVLLAGPVTVTDSKATTVTCPSVNTVGDLDGNLDPGESLTCTSTYTIVQLDVNNGTVTNSAQAHAAGVTSNTASQTAVRAGNGTVIINEVGWGGTGPQVATAADQWIELYNTTTSDIDLANWTLRGPGGKIGNASGILLLSGNIKAHEFYVIATSDAAFQGSVVDQEDPHLKLDGCGDCGDALTLENPSLAVIDTANHNGGTWPAGKTSGRASMERSCPVQPDTFTAWLTFAGTPGQNGIPIVRNRNNDVVQGTPGAQNWSCGVTITPSPVPTATKRPTPVPPKPFAHMVINEFLPRAGFDWNGDGSVDVYDEFIEIENLGPVEGNLSNWRIDAIPGDGSNSYTLPNLVLKPGQRALYYGSTTHILLRDSGDTVRLTNPTGYVIDARGYGVVDNPDQSWCRIPDGAGYWTHPCFPTPGTENSLTGTVPLLSLNPVNPIPVCLLADTVPDAFRLAECDAFGADIFNPAYWDSQAGHAEFAVPDAYSRWHTTVR